MLSKFESSKFWNFDLRVLLLSIDPSLPPLFYLVKPKLLALPPSPQKNGQQKLHSERSFSFDGTPKVNALCLQNGLRVIELMDHNSNPSDELLPDHSICYLLSVSILLVKIKYQSQILKGGIGNLYFSKLHFSHNACYHKLK